MLGPPSSPLVAGVESVIVAGAFVGFGYLLVDALVPRRSADAVLRLALAVPAVMAYVLVLMLAHMATGGRVLRAGWVPGVLTGVIAIGLIVRKVRRIRTGPRLPADGGRALLVAGLCVLVALLVWGSPLVRLLPLGSGGDTTWNMGFTSQILNGETTPASRITGDVPNYYPWLYHAVTAFLAHFTPGGRAFNALGPLQVLLVTGSVLLLFALGRELTRSWVGGTMAAVLGGISGGFGFIMVRKLDLVKNPRADTAMRYLGDLFHLRSYNVAFNNISPPFPRDVALVMLLAFLLLLGLGLTRRSVAILVAAGVALGMSGLAGAESFFIGMGVAVVMVAILPSTIGRLRAAAATLAPAVAVYSIWLVPLALSYVRLGGFKSITQVPPVVLPPAGILGAWGIATPLGAYGAYRAFPRVRRDPSVQVIFALAAVSGVALLATGLLVRSSGAGFATLGRSHRYWPLLDLSVVLFGALGATALLEWASRDSRFLAYGLATVIVGLALPSPVIASLALPGKSSPVTVLKAAVRGDERTILDVVSPSPGRACYAAVPHDLVGTLFPYSGYRLLPNSKRVRWVDIYHVPDPKERLRANKILTRGLVDPVEWVALAHQFDLDLVVGDAAAALTPAFQAQKTVSGFKGKLEYVAVWLGDCHH